MIWARRMAGEPGEREKENRPKWGGVGSLELDLPDGGRTRGTGKDDTARNRDVFRRMPTSEDGRAPIRMPNGSLALNMGSIELAGLLLPILTDGNGLTNSPDSGVGLFERCQPVEPAT